jgi:hypothetical protein
MAARSLETISSNLTEDEAIQPLTWVEFNYGSDGEMIFRSLSNAGSPAVITNAAIPQRS